MAPKIQTPVKGFTGTVAGVSFADGVGDTDDPAALAYFGRQGYTIVSEEKPKEPTERELLIAEAKELGLETKGKNEEIKKRIADHKANAAKKPADPQTPPQGDDGKTGDGADADKSDKGQSE